MPRLLPMSIVLLFRLLAFVLVAVPTVCVAVAVVFDVVPHIHCGLLVFFCCRPPASVCSSVAETFGTHPCSLKNRGLARDILKKSAFLSFF